MNRGSACPQCERTRSWVGGFLADRLDPTVEAIATYLALADDFMSGEQVGPAREAIRQAMLHSRRIAEDALIAVQREAPERLGEATRLRGGDHLPGDVLSPDDHDLCPHLHVVEEA